MFNKIVVHFIIKIITSSFSFLNFNFSSSKKRQTQRRFNLENLPNELTGLYLKHWFCNYFLDNFKNFIGNFLYLKSNDVNQNASWFWASELNQKIYQAINKLKINDYSKPILLDDGWHIFKLIDKRNDLKLSDKEYDFIKGQIMNRKTEMAIKNYLRELKKRAYIEFK